MMTGLSNAAVKMRNKIRLRKLREFSEVAIFFATRLVCCPLYTCVLHLNSLSAFAVL